MQKNRNIFTYCVMISMWLGLVLCPCHNAMAAAYIPSKPPTLVIPTPPDVTPAIASPDGLTHVCPGTDSAHPDKGFATRLIPCVRNTIIYATSNMIGSFSTFFGVTTGALITLSIVLFGILAVSGNAVVTQDGIILALKISFVVLFTNSFWGMYPYLLDSLDKMLSMMAAPVISGSFIWRDTTSTSATFCTIGTFPEGQQNLMLIWNILDCYLDIFIGGIFSPTTLYAGIIGFVVAAAFSTSIGVFIAMIGIYMLTTALFTIARVMYIFITSYIAFSFMVLVSSIFIPCIMFKSTKKYFDGWLQLTMSFFLQPIFLFGYLVMFLVAFNNTVFHGHHSLYYTIAGTDSEASGFQLGQWLNDNGTYYETTFDKKDIKINFTGGAIEGGVLAASNTGVADIVGQRTTVDPTSGKITAFGVGDGTPNNPLNFFESGVNIMAINWTTLVSLTMPQQYTDAVVADKTAVPPVTTQEDALILNYQMNVLMAFIMLSVFMYLFYSLLDYIPHIGNTAMIGESAVSFGFGGLSMPGSKMFAGGGA